MNLLIPLMRNLGFMDQQDLSKKRKKNMNHDVITGRFDDD